LIHGVLAVVMMHTPLIGLTPLVIPIGLIHWKKYSLGERYFFTE
jgi:hypothetical protein